MWLVRRWRNWTALMLLAGKVNHQSIFEKLSVPQKMISLYLILEIKPRLLSVLETWADTEWQLSFSSLLSTLPPSFLPLTFSLPPFPLPSPSLSPLLSPPLLLLLLPTSLSSSSCLYDTTSAVAPGTHLRDTEGTSQGRMLNSC